MRYPVQNEDTLVATLCKKRCNTLYFFLAKYIINPLSIACWLFFRHLSIKFARTRGRRKCRGKMFFQSLFSCFFLFLFLFREHLFYITRIFNTNQNGTKGWEMRKNDDFGEELFSRMKKVGKKRKEE
jgi:hypothetical protein